MVDSVLGDDSQKLDGFLTDVHTGIVSFSAMQVRDGTFNASIV